MSEDALVIGKTTTLSREDFNDLVKALEDTIRMLEAVRLSAGLGLKQLERLGKARAALAKVKA